MSRSIPKWLSGILESLELERPEFVTTSDMERLLSDTDISIPARVVASRLRERGWLLETSQRGVWEFVPAEVAGAFSTSDPLMALKAFMLANPLVECALTFQSAAWALGFANRVPRHIEVAFAEQPKVKVPEDIALSTYRPALSTKQVKGVPTLPPEAIIIHMVQRPSAVRSWHSATEWLSDVAYELIVDDLLFELEGRTPSVWARTGYLLQGMRPDVAEAIESIYSPKTKARFGSVGKALRNDEHWKVSDRLLPFDPRTLEELK